MRIFFPVLSSADRLFVLGLFLSLLGFYTFFLGGELAYTRDSNPVVAVTEVFLQTGSYATPLEGDPPYSIYGIGMSIWYTPIRWAIHHLLPGGLTLETREYWRRQGYIFLNVLASAGTGFLLAIWSLQVGCSRWGTLLGTLCYGLGTFQLPYARYDFTEPVSGFFLLGGTYCLWKYAESGAPGLLWFGGSSLACGALTRIPVGFLALLFAVVLIHPVLRERRPSDFVAFLTPLSFALGVIFYYNYARFGNIWQTGYPVHFDTPLWKGIGGLLLSPGQGALFYTPVSLMGLFTVFRSKKPDRFLKVLVGVSCVGFLLLNAKWRYWYGGWSWGPRLLLPVLTYSGLGLSLLFSDTRYRLFWSVLLFGAGGLINFLAIYIPYSDYRYTLIVNRIPESAGLWNPKYAPLKIQHEYLSQVWWRNYDFMWLKRSEWGWMVWVVAAAGVATAILGVFLIRKSLRS